jgi:hypothetical protein
MLDGRGIERSIGWKVMDALVTPVLKHGAGNWHLACSKLLLLGLLLAALATTLTDRRAEVINTSDSIWVGSISACVVPNVFAYENMDPVWRTPIESEASLG